MGAVVPRYSVVFNNDNGMVECHKKSKWFCLQIFRVVVNHQGTAIIVKHGRNKKLIVWKVTGNAKNLTTLIKSQIPEDRLVLKD